MSLLRTAVSIALLPAAAVSAWWFTRVYGTRAAWPEPQMVRRGEVKP